LPRDPNKTYAGRVKKTRNKDHDTERNVWVDV